MFTFIHGTKREIKWYLRRMSKDEKIVITNISDYVPKKQLTMEEFLKADRDNIFYKVRVDFIRK